jgi:hypothetical protein
MQIEQLGHVGRVWTRDDVLNDEHPALGGGGTVERREQLATRRVIPVITPPQSGGLDGCEQP